MAVLIDLCVCVCVCVLSIMVPALGGLVDGWVGRLTVKGGWEWLVGIIEIGILENRLGR